MNETFTLMDAVTARTQAESITTKVRGELSRPSQAISKAVGEGVASITISGALSVPVLKVRERQGYSTKTWYDQRDGDYTWISW